MKAGIFIFLSKGMANSPRGLLSARKKQKWKVALIHEKISKE
ncbi:hypothetical protein [Photorhabdus noenieputensis]|nr:hypothetical protein [Photorhabdus noenieputensis]